MTSVLDEKRRVVLPKEIAEELGLVEGTPVSFKKGKGLVIMQKAKRGGDALKETMAWNPKRTGKPAPVEEAEIKEMWR